MPQTSAAAFKPSGRGYLHPFWDGSRFWYGVGEKPRTLIELAMCSLSAELRSSETWWDDRLDPWIRQSWIENHAGCSRAVETSSGIMGIVLNAKQVEYVVDELSGYAALRDEQNHCQVSCFERIWESTQSLPTEIVLLLDSELQAIREMHNSTLNKAPSLDIIDPYVCPVVYHRTLVRSPDSQLHPIPHPILPPIDGYTLSTRFACLPTTFSISSPGKPLTARAHSYINNVDPSLTSLYTQIENILAHSISLFEHILTDLHRDNPVQQRIKGSCKYTEWDEPEEPEHSDDEEGWQNYQRELRTWTFQRPISIPDIPESGYPGGLEQRRTTVTLRGKNVKVLLRVTDIKLKPGGPHYFGMPWRVEGMRNEHIVACAFHCISSNNIKPLSVSFRMSVCSPLKFVAGDEGATARTWGLRHNSPANQSLGKVQLIPRRSVAFPNIYQHQFHPTELVDPQKEGSMTLLSLFLVDPDLSGDEHDADGFEILTTSSVPPQQKGWMKRAVEESLDVRIPNEIVEKIVDLVDGAMSDDDIRDIADEMRRERERFRASHDRYWFNLRFDVWSGEGHLQ